MSMKVVLGDYLVSTGWDASERKDKYGDWPASCSFIKPVLGGFSPQKAYEMDKRQPRYVIYDLETAKAFPKKGEAIEPGIEYCEGWTDYKGCGISVLAAYVSLTDRVEVFLQDNLPQFESLLGEIDYVIGFNTVKFDNNVVTAAGLSFHERNKQYDILRAMYEADGLDPDKWSPSTHGGYKLDTCLDVNFGVRKTDSGAMAPINWQRGRHGEVISYCIADVMLTKRLFDKIMADGWIYHPKYPGKKLTIKRPFAPEWEEFVI